MILKSQTNKNNINMKKYILVKLKKETVINMISSYEFLAWNNKGTEEGKECRNILKALKKTLKENK